MARMLPEKIPLEIERDPRHGAERRVYQALARELPPDYTVFGWSSWVGRTGESSVREGELDFVVAHPEEGILVIEVKGGNVDFDPEKGIWLSRDANGALHQIKDPYHQATVNQHALVHKLEEMPDAPPRHPFVGRAVWFPDVPRPSAPLRADAPAEISGFREDVLAPLAFVRKRHGLLALGQVANPQRTSGNRGSGEAAGSVVPSQGRPCGRAAALPGTDHRADRAAVPDHQRNGRQSARARLRGSGDRKDLPGNRARAPAGRAGFPHAAVLLQQTPCGVPRGEHPGHARAHRPQLPRALSPRGFRRRADLGSAGVPRLCERPRELLLRGTAAALRARHAGHRHALRRHRRRRGAGLRPGRSANYCGRPSPDPTRTSCGSSRTRPSASTRTRLSGAKRGCSPTASAGTCATRKPSTPC